MFEEAIGDTKGSAVVCMTRREFKEGVINRGHWMGQKLLPIINAVAAIVDGSGKGAMFIVVEGDTVKMWCRDGSCDRRGEPTTKPIEAVAKSDGKIAGLDYSSSGEL